MQFYEEFSPLILNQHANRNFLTFTTFDAAMDEFFSKVESQRIEQQKKAQEDSAFQKLEKIRKDQVTFYYSCQLVVHTWSNNVLRTNGKSLLRDLSNSMQHRLFSIKSLFYSTFLLVSK